MASGPKVGEVYTIKQVTDLTGVSENTIRSWERRHGWPSPFRSSGNQRRYTGQQIDEIRQVWSERQSGLTVEQALAGLGVISTDEQTSPPVPPVESNPPRLLQAVPAGKPASIFSSNPIVDTLRSGDLAAANQALSDCFLRLGIDGTITEVMVPAYSRLQQERLTGSISSLTALQADSWLFRKMDALLEQSAPENGSPRIALMSIQDHELAFCTLAMATRLSRAGVQVTNMHEPTNLDIIREALTTSTHDAIVAIAQSESAHLIAGAAFPDTDALPRPSTSSGISVYVASLGPTWSGRFATTEEFGEATDGVLAALRMINPQHQSRSSS